MAALGAIVVVVLLLWAAYIAAGAYMLRVLVPRRVPGLALRARTLVPGRVRVGAFRLQGDGWTLTARQAWIRLPWLAPLREPLVFDRLEAAGVTFAWSAHPGGAAAGSDLRIGAFDARVEEINLGDWRLRVPGRLTGGPLELRASGTAALGPLRWTAGDGDVTRRGTPVARVRQADVRLAAQELGAAPLDLGAACLELDADVSADLPGLSVFDFYFARTPWVALEEGPGPVEARVVLREGAFAPGTHARFRSERAGARILDWHARGPGDLTFAVDDAGARLALTLGSYEVVRSGRDVPDLRGSGFTLAARAPRVVPGRPLDDVSFRLDVPRGEIPDVSVLNDFVVGNARAAALAGGNARAAALAGGNARAAALAGGNARATARAEADAHAAARAGDSSRAAAPAGGGERSAFAFVGGRALWEGHIDVPAGGGDASGRIRFEGEAVELHLANLWLMADLALDGQLAGGNLLERRFGLAGTSLAIRNLALARVGRETGRQSGWHADVHLPRGSITLTTPASLDARVDLALRDSGPILALFTPQRGLPGWIEKLLLVHDVAAIAEFELAAGRVRFRELAVQGGPLHLEARLTLAPEGSSGDLLARFGAFAAGLELRDGELRIRRLREAARWFDRRG